ncbi:unnamed protein product [Rotaria sp. Silwood2]|nr:unnamed protein product [Rotaria sp. Silwood2]CAF2910341.1 unnamed protein product [Rotaria sp. Silwood2]
MTDLMLQITLLSLRSPTEITIFPDHLVERRFLDEENYIDLDRMLVEKAGKFDFKSFDMRNGPMMPSRIHKYDFSDSAVIEKVKNRRPKDSLTPQQVAALTSVATRYQSSTLLNSHQIKSSHVWIDDYSHQQIQFNLSRHLPPPQPLMPYARQNPNQCELYTNQIKSLLPTYQSTIEQKNNNTIIKKINTIPILQRLFEAQQLQQNQHRKINSSPITDIFDQQSPSYLTSTPKHYEQGLYAFCTPPTPKQLNWNKSFERIFSINQSHKTANKQHQNVFTQLINEHLKFSATMETPTTPNISINETNNNTHHSKKDDDKQNFYSAPLSPIQQHESSPSLLSNHTVDKLCFSTSVENHPLEYWFGTSIYTNTYPRMPSDHVLSACDFEQ